MTIDPNDVLSRIRHHITDAEQSYDAHHAAALASLLIAHLDAGGPLPDAWTPFHTPSADHERKVAQIEHVAAVRGDDSLYWQEQAREARADLAAALQTIEQAAANTQTTAELEAWAKVDPAAARNWAFWHHAQITSEPDPRSVAGQTADAIKTWRDLPQDSYNDTDHLIVVTTGDYLANAAQALLDCQPDERQPTHLEMEQTIQRLRRDRDRAEQQRQRDADTIDRLTHDLARAASDTEHLKLCRNADAQKIDRLTAELAQAREHGRQMMNQRDTADPRQQRQPIATDAAYALVARAAAHLCDNATDAFGGNGDAREIRSYTDHVLRDRQHATSAGQARTELAAMLAVGASKYGSNRKSADLAERTAAHLRTLADHLS